MYGPPNVLLYAKLQNYIVLTIKVVWFLTTYFTHLKIVCDCS